MVDLILANDCGTSSNKNVFSVNKGKAELLVMSPALIEVSRDSIDNYKSRRLSYPDPSDEAWIEVAGQAYFVGFLAEKELGASIDVKQVKYENAIRKILAVIGAIAVIKGLPSKFGVGVASLLPRREWENRSAFQEGLTEALADFAFCDRPFSVNLQLFQCRPEGAGLSYSRSRRVGAAYKRMTVPTLMFGYRDLSIELLERGITSGETQKLGLYWLLSRIISRTSDQELQPLLEALHQAGNTIKPKKFRHLVRSTGAENRAKEEVQIAEAVRLSRLEYWNRISSWLRSVIPSKIDEVIIGGGTAEYLKPELQAYFAGVPISWAADLQEDVRRAFNIPPEDDHLSLRLTDVYGIYRCLQRQVFPSLVDVGRQD
ncbi:MAG: ParM/StbA family protein [Chroococcidiopsidaceae cyanobacterium CP_BM_ER_R8_30]|nr:ParM/StbA family protein [Chroococcidiopsidaceae cyanobacterium CP_BM_ER_R8_30]